MDTLQQIISYVGESQQKIHKLKHWGKVQNRTEHRYFGHSPKIYYYYNQNLRRTEEK